MSLLVRQAKDSSQQAVPICCFYIDLINLTVGNYVTRIYYYTTIIRLLCTLRNRAGGLMTMRFPYVSSNISATIRKQARRIIIHIWRKMSISARITQLFKSESYLKALPCAVGHLHEWWVCHIISACDVSNGAEIIRCSEINFRLDSNNSFKWATYCLPLKRA